MQQITIKIGQMMMGQGASRMFAFYITPTGKTKGLFESPMISSLSYEDYNHPDGSWSKTMEASAEGTPSIQLKVMRTMHGSISINACLVIKLDAEAQRYSIHAPDEAGVFEGRGTIEWERSCKICGMDREEIESAFTIEITSPPKRMASKGTRSLLIRKKGSKKKWR